jgi:transposase
MQLTMKSRLKLKSHLEDAMRQLSHACKNIYNVCVYETRQHYFNTKTILPTSQLFHKIKHHYAYLALSSDNAQLTMRRSKQAFRSFMALQKAKKQGTYTSPVRLPRYLKKKGFAPVYFIPRQ